MTSGILLLSWLLSIGTLNLQQVITQGDFVVGYQAPPSTYSTTLGVEALFFDHFFISGSVTTFEAFNKGSFLFNPSESLYVFSAGARTHGVELGIRHECDHITLSSLSAQNGFFANKTEVYISVRGSFAPF